MFLYRFFIGPIAALVITAFMVAFWSTAGPAMLCFMGAFALLMLICSIMTVKHVRGLRIALKQEPEQCSIDVKMIPGGRKGPPSYIAEMSLDGDIWRAILAGNAFERSCVGGSNAGRVWRHPVSKVPYAAAINGTKLAIIPTVVKVNPDSIVEHMIQRVHGPLAKPSIKQARS